jgi:hypothetical protein
VNEKAEKGTGALREGSSFTTLTYGPKDTLGLIIYMVITNLY